MQHPDNPAAAANDRRLGSQATYGGNQVTIQFNRWRKS